MAKTLPAVAGESGDDLPKIDWFELRGIVRWLYARMEEYRQQDVRLVALETAHCGLK